MREIKFRAWDKKDKVMRYSDDDRDIAVGENRVYSLDSEPYGSDMTGQWIPLQFISLHDRNGKEIYEGDIVKDPLSGITVVKITLRYGSMQSYPDITIQTEIIGNIYENPELLKGA